MTRGRKPVPDKVHLLRGNPKGKKLDLEKGSAIEDKFPKCPTYLNKEAKQEWRRLQKVLSEIGIIKEIDLGILAAYCQACATFQEANRLLEEYGYIITTSNGNIIQSPAVGIASTARDSIRKLSAELGFSPSARERVKYPSKDNNNDPFEELMKRRNG